MIAGDNNAAAGPPLEWFYRVGTDEIGPLPASEIQRRLDIGDLPEQTQVRSSAMQRWAPLPFHFQRSRAARAPVSSSTHTLDVDAAPTPAAPPRRPSTNAAAALERARAARSAEPTGSYFLRHWRGELSLPVSYWIDGVLLGWASLLLVMAAVGKLAHWKDAHSVQGGLLAITTFVVALSIWQMVGILRSAQNHKRRTGRIGWATLAQVAAVFGLVQLVGAVGEIRDVYEKLDEVADKQQSLNGFRLSVEARGTRIRVEGSIGLNYADAVMGELAAHPGAHELVLTSLGGLLQEAYDLNKRLAKVSDLTTRVASHCASACTVVWLAGRHRVLDYDAKLGFHRPANLVEGFGDEKASVANYEAFLRQSHVPDTLISEAMAKRGNDVVLADVPALFDAGVLTSVRKGEASLDKAGYIQDAVVTAITDSSSGRVWAPLLAAARAHQPRLFAPWAAASYEALIRDDHASLQRVTIKLSRDLLAASASKASAPSVVAFFRTESLQAAYLLHYSSPSTCRAYLERSGAQDAPFDPQIVQARFAALAEMVETAAKSDYPFAPDASRAQAAQASAARAALAQQPAGMQFEQIKADDALYCRFMIDYVAGLAAMPEAEGANAIREILLHPD